MTINFNIIIHALAHSFLSSYVTSENVQNLTDSSLARWLTTLLLSHGNVIHLLKVSIRNLFVHHDSLIKAYDVPISRMICDFLGCENEIYDNILQTKVHPYMYVHQRNLLILDFSCFIRLVWRVLFTNRGRSLFTRTWSYFRKFVVRLG